MSKLIFCVLVTAATLCFGNDEVTTANKNETVNDYITIMETNSYNNNVDSVIYINNLDNIHESNDLWRRNDKVAATNAMYFDNIAKTETENYDQQKRAYSIIISGLYLSLLNGGDQSIRLNLNEPADVIVSDLKNVIYQMFTVYEPILDGVKSFCRPTTSQQECEYNLNNFIKEEEQRCKGFSEHVRFWRSTLYLFNDKDYRVFLCDFRQTSQRVQNDQEAIKYLNQLTSGRKHPEAIRKLRVWFNGYASGNYPCNLPPVKCDKQQMTGEKQQVIYIIREKEKYRKHHRDHHKHHKHDSSSEEHHHYRYDDEGKEQIEEEGIEKV